MSGLLTRFRIEGLHNLWTIDVAIEDNKLVLVGENGTGKTTIANLIYFFLTCQWHRLLSYSFKSILVTLDSEEITLKYDGLLNIDRKALFLNKLPLSLVRLFNNLSCEDIDLLRESSDKLEEFAKQMNVPGSEINRYISKFPTEDLFSYKLTQIEQKIDEDSIADQILYLPAYRRIEQGLQSIFSDRPQEIEVIRARIRQGKKDLRGKELVDFGMEDVETKICQINKNDVKNVEDKAIIGNFLKVCNSYLSNKKELVYDHVRSEIFVRQSLEGIQNQPVTLNKLSSGEKQIVSLFAHLYLSEQKSYFVIIDEPELSLSVPWQRRFLTDILETKRCNGLIAVTHSPFVYDNELKQYAHSLEEFMEVSHVLS